MTTDTPGGHGWRLVALSLAMLLPSLGTSIANVALPSLKAAFGSSSQDVQWVVIAYLMAVTAFLVAAGRLGDLFGKRRTLLAGMALFAMASVAGAVAPNLWVLVAARGLQGVGAATMMALTVAAAGDMVPRERTGSTMGFLGTVSAVGTALGPSLGGLLIAALGWPAVFGFMAVTGLASLAVAYRMLPADSPREMRRAPFDFAGAALLVAAVGSFALATTLVPVNTVNLALAIVAAGAAVVFVLIEKTVASPLVRLALLGNRTISAGLVSIGLVSAIMMTTLVVGPFYLTHVLGLGPAWTGLVMTTGPTVAALVGVPAGRLVDRFGSSPMALVGLGGVVLGAMMMTWLAHAAGVGGYVASLVPVTAGYALFQAANNTAVMVEVGKDQRGVASALISLARNLGLVTGASAMGLLFALGSGGLPSLGLAPGGEAGLMLTFAVATGLAAVALAASAWGMRSRSR